MPRPKTYPRFRYHTINEFESFQEQRVRTEDIAENSIYEAMTRLVQPHPDTPEVVSMLVRIENIAFNRSKNQLARISLQIILLDQDYQPSISRMSSMTNGTWSFDKPLELTTAKPMKVGFLLPSLPDDLSTDPFTNATTDIREDADAFNRSSTPVTPLLV